MFSVLLSVYYKEKPEFLQQSLDSILSQTLLKYISKSIQF